MNTEIKTGISEDNIAAIKDGSMQTPCYFCGINQSLTYLGIQYETANRLLLGCEECNTLFVLDTNTGFIHKDNVGFTSLYSLTYSRVPVPGKPAILLKVVQKKY